MTEPDRIWAEHWVGLDEESREWSEKPQVGAPEYVRRDPAVLAALPEVQALIRQAVEAEREACAHIGYFTCAETRHGTLGSAVAAAIRKRGEG